MKTNKWNIEKIKAGFEKFKIIYGKYPSVKEIDKFEYLPASRTLQRRFGGAVGIRKKFGLGITNYTKGKYRSNKAKESYKRAEKYEEYFYKFLISKIPEVRIHEQKRIRPGNVSSDFFIYNENGDDGIVIDLFYISSLDNLNSVINIKNLRYRLLDEKYEIFYVLVGNNKILQSEINNLIKNKKSLMPENIKVYTEEEFKKRIVYKLY